MRALLDLDTIQIEITNACINQCANCSRFVGHHKKPFFMDMDTFKKAVDSMITYPKMTGIQGGEPLLHPQFEEMCNYLHSRLHPVKCGLWTTLPTGYEHYRELIVRTFGHIFINDHSRNDILHWPALVSIQEFPFEKWAMWFQIHHCWAQLSWSASINPKGAFFCEMAASLAILLDEDGAWPVTPDWWTKVPMDFVSQMEKYCPMCGMAVSQMKRVSTEGIDDISPKMYERLKDTSPKIKAGKYKISDLQICNDNRQMATYKEQGYRDKIADRYGMFLMGNEQNFLTPFLRKNWKKYKINQKEGEVIHNDNETQFGEESRSCSGTD